MELLMSAQSNQIKLIYDVQCSIKCYMYQYASIVSMQSHPNKKAHRRSVIICMQRLEGASSGHAYCVKRCTPYSVHTIATIRSIIVPGVFGLSSGSATMSICKWRSLAAGAGGHCKSGLFLCQRAKMIRNYRPCSTHWTGVPPNPDSNRHLYSKSRTYISLKQKLWLVWPISMAFLWWKIISFRE